MKLKFKESIILNVLLMGIITVLIILCISIFLNYYTKHGESISIPNVRGLEIREASGKIRSVGLDYEITDSIYSQDIKPGTIVETHPRIGSNVKKGRTIYITINAKNPRPVILPDIENVSSRQAISQLNALGLIDVSIKYVPGEFDDLCLQLETKEGRLLPPNTKVNVNTSIILIVSKIDLADSSLIKEEAIVDKDWM